MQKNPNRENTVFSKLEEQICKKREELQRWQDFAREDTRLLGQSTQMANKLERELQELYAKQGGEETPPPPTP